MNNYPVLQPITRKELDWQLDLYLERGNSIQMCHSSKYYPRKLRERNFSKTFIKHSKFISLYGERTSQDINRELGIDPYVREGVSWNY